MCTGLCAAFVSCNCTVFGQDADVVELGFGLAAYVIWEMGKWGRKEPTTPDWGEKREFMELTTVS